MAQFLDFKTVTFTDFRLHFPNEAIQKEHLKTKNLVNSNHKLSHAFWNYDEKVGCNEFADYLESSTSSDLYKRQSLKDKTYCLSETLRRRVY